MAAKENSPFTQSICTNVNRAKMWSREPGRLRFEVVLDGKGRAGLRCHPEACRFEYPLQIERCQKMIS